MFSKLLANTLLALGAILPVSAVRWIADRVGRLVFYIPSARRGLLLNARRILGESSTQKARRELAVLVLRNFAASVADLVLGSRVWNDEGEALWTVEGAENFDVATSGRRGFVALTLHMGSYELGCRIIARKTGDAAVVYHRDPSGFFEALRSRQRRASSIDEIAVDESPFFGIELLNRLKRGAVVLMAGELAAGPRGERFRFLDGEAHFSLWPARLAIAASVPILPAFTVRVSADRFRLHLEPIVEVHPDDDPRELTARLVQKFERFVRTYPDQWLMVRPFWKDDQQAAAPSYNARGAARSDKGTRTAETESHRERQRESNR